MPLDRRGQQPQFEAGALEQYDDGVLVMMSVGVTYFTSSGAAQKQERQIPLDTLVEQIRDASASEKSALPWLKQAEKAAQRDAERAT